MQLNKLITENLIELVEKQTNILNELKAQPRDWHEVLTDTLILVRNGDESRWDKQYFSHYDDTNERIHVYYNGKTSKTERSTTKYIFAKLMEEDIGKY